MSIEKMLTNDMEEIFVKEFKIIPNNIDPYALSDSYRPFVNSMEDLISEVFLKKLFCENYFIKNSLEDAFMYLLNNLPLIEYSNLIKSGQCFSFYILVPGEHTEGIGRFLVDALSKWLMPGKHLSIKGIRALNFTFQNKSNSTFYVSEYFIYIPTDKDLQFIKNNIQNFINQLKVNILSVYNARHIISHKKLTEEEKSAIIQENISSLIYDEKNELRIGSSAYDEMQNFLYKLTSEKTLSQIYSNLDSLMNKKPHNFDGEIFKTINFITATHNDHFTAERTPKYISKLIAYQFLFNKQITHNLKKLPKKRHIALKILKVQNYLNKEKKKPLGILFTMSINSKIERFEKEHFIKSISNCLSNISFLKNSFFQDKRSSNKITLYIEIKNNNKSKFTFDEINSLKKDLPIEIKASIEKVINPIFMPRNEEESLRNIVLLSNQIKFVRDIPQLIISYESQTDREVSFIVTLVRLLKKDTPAISSYFQNPNISLKYQHEETKIIGTLKNKYPKEVNIFKLSLEKKEFYRRDFSVDLYKARRIIVSKLANVLGDFRDYNGGMIHKQTEVLDELKQNFPNFNIGFEFLMENFFYSIKPAVMQSILDTTTLTAFFSLMTEALEYNYKKELFFIKKIQLPKYIIISIASPKKNIVEKAMQFAESKQITSFNLTKSYLQEKDIHILGYVYRNNDPAAQKIFFDRMLDHITS